MNFILEALCVEACCGNSGRGKSPAYTHILEGKKMPAGEQMVASFIGALSAGNDTALAHFCLCVCMGELCVQPQQYSIVANA